MTKREEKFLEDAFKEMAQMGELEELQKENLLQRILIEGRREVPFVVKLKNLIIVYPWRFAFGVSVVQTVSCTLLWGERYTRFIMQLIGG